MSEFIELLSPSALKDMQTANAELVTMIKNVDSVNSKMKGINTPSGSDSAIKGLTSEYQKQEKVIQSLQTKLVALNEEKKKSNQRTVEETVNQGILNRQATQQAVIQSTLAGAYQKLSAQQAKSARVVQDLIARGKTATQSQRQYNLELRNAEKDFAKLNVRVLSADRAVGKFNRNVGNYPMQAITGLKDLIGAFGVVGGVSAIAMVAKDIFQTTKELQSLDNALKLVTGTQSNYASQTEFLNRISESYGANIKDLTKQFTQFYVSAKDKLSGDKIQDIFESVTKAGASMGLTVQSQERAFLALNQMMSKGTIQAEELRGQLGEALPGAFGIMAKAMGITEKQLAKMMKDGNVIASEVLPKFAKQLEITYGIENVNRIDSLATAQTRLANSWVEFVRSLDEGGNKLSKVLIGTLSVLSDVVKGTQLLFTSSEKLAEKTLVKANQTAFDAQMEYLKSVKDISDEEIEAIRIYNRRKIKENSDTIRALDAQNKTFVEKGKGFFANRNQLKKDFKENADQIENLNRINARYAGQIKATNVFQQEQNDIVKKNTELTKEQIKAEEDRLKQLFANRKKELELELFVIDQTMNNEDALMNDRLTALELHRKKRQEILILQYNEEMRLAKGNYGLQKDALLDFHKEVLQEIESFKKEEEKIQSTALVSADVVKLSDAQKQLAKNATLVTAEFVKQAQQTEKNKKYMEDYQKAIQDYLDTFKEGFFSDAGFPTLFKVLNKEIAGFGDNFAVTFTAMAEIAQEAFAFISEASNANFENEYKNLSQQKEIALMFAGDSASAKEEIERQYETKRRAIREREWKAEKQMALFNIAIDTAQAVVASVAKSPETFGLPFSAVALAIGAAQASVVASQQMPAFWKGTENAPEGWAWTQEKGREIITDASGKVKSTGSDSGAVATYLSAGDKVYTAEKSAMMFDENLNGILSSAGISMPKVDVKLNVDMSGVISAIQNKESVHLSIDKGGLHNYVTNGHSRKEDMRNRVKFIGRNV